MGILYLATAAVLLFVLGDANAQAPDWGQCGGIGWSGPTICGAGYTCIYLNPYHSQCLPVTSTTTPPSTTTTSGPVPTGSQIRTVQDPVYHFYLQDNGGKPQLGPESSSGRFTISGSISLNQSNGSKLYLNLNNTASTSYKPLAFGTTGTTTNWGLEGDTIITTSPRQLNFIACATTNPSFYDIYLQTGNDTPAGASCTLVTIHLPCLC